MCSALADAGAPPSVFGALVGASLGLLTPPSDDEEEEEDVDAFDLCDDGVEGECANDEWEDDENDDDDK